LDLSNAANLVIYYQSSDKIHPNIWGYDSLVKGMEIAMVPTNPKNVAFTSDSSSITVNWSNQMSWYDIESVITSYEMEYKLHIDDNWNNPIEKIPYSPIEQPTYTFSSLASGNYDIRIRAINELPINQPIYSEYSVVENIEVPA
jgi:predicted phage tail protein